MANSVWGKWTQNPSGQQEIKMCGSIHEYHDFLKTGCVKRVSLISDKLLQVELKLDRQIDGENREIKAMTSCSTHKIDQQETDG